VVELKSERPSKAINFHQEGIVRIQFSAAPLRYATSDGRQLCFDLAPGSLISVDVNFRRVQQPDWSRDAPESEAWKWTVLAVDFDIADAAGQVWRLTSHVSADLFVRHMMDFSVGSILLWNDADEEMRKRFQQNILLTEIRYGNDDRVGRQLVVGDHVASVVFHYTAISFDLAAFPLYDYAGCPPELLVRYNSAASPMWDSSVEDSQEIPDLLFSVRWEYLLDNHWYLNQRGTWSHSDFPIPLVAQPVERQVEPQSDIRVVK
jgi:hypothetical protein